MSDFLGRLIQKSLPARERAGTRLELAPRLPSLFEAPGGDVSSPESAPESSSADPRLEAPRHTEEGSWPSRTVLPPAQTPGPGRPPAGAAPETTSLRATKPAQKVTGEASGHTQAPPAPVIEAQVVPHAQEPSAVPRAAAPAVQPALARLAPPRPPALPPTRRERRSGNADVPTGQVNGTTIRINIGRIEVRAVHPPQAPAAPRQRSEAKR